MRSRILRGVLVAAAIAAGSAVLFSSSRAPIREARADDLCRVTSLQVLPNYAGDGAAHIVARFSSTDSIDARVEVALRWFDPGQPPRESLSTYVDRWSFDEPVDTEASIVASEFPSTNVQAVFTAYDSTGAVTSTTSRTIWMP